MVAAATFGLALVAAGFLVSAGVVVLSGMIGFPGAAIVFAVLFALLAVLVHLRGRVLAARRAQRLETASSRFQAETVRATALAAPSTGPVLPLIALVAAFVLARKA